MSTSNDIVCSNIIYFILLSNFVFVVFSFFNKKFDFKPVIFSQMLNLFCAFVNCVNLYLHPNFKYIDDFICNNKISALVTLFITLISLIIITFSQRYLSQDKFQNRFATNILLLSTLAILVNLSNNLLLTFSSLISLTLVLNRTISFYKSDSKNYLILSDFCLFVVFSLLYLNFHSWRIDVIEAQFVKNAYGPNLYLINLLILAAIIIKSAMFPFHKWLLNLLDAPTPLSGFMHAGIVNIATIIVLKFHFLLIHNDFFFYLWFGIALLSTIVASMIMSTRSDIKSELAYSTMGQMGFMNIQLCLGLYPLALFHIISHGFFKCYMFLQSSNTINDSVYKQKNLLLSDKSKSLKSISAFAIIIMLISLFIKDQMRDNVLFLVFIFTSLALVFYWQLGKYINIAKIISMLLAAILIPFVLYYTNHAFNSFITNLFDTKIVAHDSLLLFYVMCLFIVVDYFLVLFSRNKFSKYIYVALINEFYV